MTRINTDGTGQIKTGYSGSHLALLTSSPKPQGLL